MQPHEERLARLPVGKLIELAALGMRESSEAAHVGNAMINEFDPLPQWVVSDILLSPDLLEPIMAQLSLKDGSQLRLVCSVWRAAWKARCAGHLGFVRTVEAKAPTLFEIRQGLPEGQPLGFPRNVVARPGGGALVPDYNNFCLKFLTPSGDVERVLDGDPDRDLSDDRHPLYTPSAACIIDTSTAWIVESDKRNLTKVNLDSGAKNFTAHDFEDLPNWAAGPGEGRPFPGDQNINPIDLAMAGDRLLVLMAVRDDDTYTMGLLVLQARTGAYIHYIGLDGIETGGYRMNCFLVDSSLAADGDLVYISDPIGNRVVVMNHMTGEQVRSIGHQNRLSGSEPGEFWEPVGVAVGHGRLYVSERAGGRIQVLTLEGEPLQVLSPPDGDELGGMCVDGDRVWCLGPRDEKSHVHLLELVGSGAAS